MDSFIGFDETVCEVCGRMIIFDPTEVPAPNCCDSCRAEIDRIRKRWEG